ncbi:hypothetical protein [Chitinophaga nivalis]|uniref:SMI1/KNR4 family protein n=1 Tax=Chitinophaga nivalis TaxID=2991709 RepID=A0ABT3ILI1_9BACT|nr:hypothetical protein [Chitinophaga nivalis]MCW3465475.1 hypothetical protein [Chitinophaga nivalis]MCW3484834.1 hypothetical protein [Chitinophaga nivalis]
MKEKTALVQLINSLTCYHIDAATATEIADICLTAKQDPEAYFRETDEDMLWLLEVDPQGLTAFILTAELYDYFAVSDKMDEFHEQVQEIFEDNDLPDYPYNQQLPDLTAYFNWLNGELAANDIQVAPIYFGDSYGDDIQVIFVPANDITTILDLCASLQIKASRCA